MLYSLYQCLVSSLLLWFSICLVCLPSSGALSLSHFIYKYFFSLLARFTSSHWSLPLIFVSLRYRLCFFFVVISSRCYFSLCCSPWYFCITVPLDFFFFCSCCCSSRLLLPSVVCHCCFFSPLYFSCVLMLPQLPFQLMLLLVLLSAVCVCFLLLSLILSATPLCWLSMISLSLRLLFCDTAVSCVWFSLSFLFSFYCWSHSSLFILLSLYFLTTRLLLITVLDYCFSVLFLCHFWRLNSTVLLLFHVTTFFRLESHKLHDYYILLISYFSWIYCWLFAVLFHFRRTVACLFIHFFFTSADSGKEKIFWLKKTTLPLSFRTSPPLSCTSRENNCFLRVLLHTTSLLPQLFFISTCWNYFVVFSSLLLSLLVLSISVLLFFPLKTLRYWELWMLSCPFVLFILTSFKIDFEIFRCQISLRSLLSADLWVSCVSEKILSLSLSVIESSENQKYT